MSTSASRLAPAGGTRRRLRSPEARRWLFMRVSGVLLAVLVAGHLLDTSVIHDVTEVDTAFIANRWRNPFWRVWDGALLALGIAHGAQGIRIVIEDVVDDPRRRLAAITALAVATGAVALLAAVTVLAA